MNTSSPLLIGIILWTWNVASSTAFLGISPCTTCSRFTNTCTQTSLRDASAAAHGSAVSKSLHGEQHAGVPPILQELPCGQSILGYRRMPDSSLHNVTVERVSVTPPIFVLKNFATTLECNDIQSSVSTMQPAQTASGIQENVSRKHSHVAWLAPDQANGVVGRLAQAARNILLASEHANNMGVEDMQVVRYDSGGEYVLHHDGHDRILTVLYYLNGAGETWFPLAETDMDSSVRMQQGLLTRSVALERADKLQPGVDGVLVSAKPCSTRTKACVPVRQGDAVAFYSYRQDGSMDWNAIHAGLPASQVKYIANHFFR